MRWFIALCHLATAALWGLLGWELQQPSPVRMPWTGRLFILLAILGILVVCLGEIRPLLAR